MFDGAKLTYLFKKDQRGGALPTVIVVKRLFDVISNGKPLAVTREAKRSRVELSLIRFTELSLIRSTD